MADKDFVINDDGSIAFKDEKPSDKTREAAEKAAKDWADKQEKKELAEQRETASDAGVDRVDELPVADDREKGA